MKRKFFERNEWRKTVDPVFVQYWSATKRMNAAEADQAERKRAFDDLAKASRLMHKQNKSRTRPHRYAEAWKEITRPLDGEVWPGHGEVGKAYAVNPEASVFFRDLVFLKLGITFRELITQAETDRSAHLKLLRIHRDFYRFRWEAGGFDNLRLKFNMNHFSILLQGMDLGLDELNETELESCFNEICPCAQRHSGEYLKKLRTRLRQVCERIQHSASKPTTVELPGGRGTSA